jgi:hypothetical protein
MGSLRRCMFFDFVLRTLGLTVRGAADLREARDEGVGSGRGLACAWASCQELIWIAAMELHIFFCLILRVGPMSHILQGGSACFDCASRAVLYEWCISSFSWNWRAMTSRRTFRMAALKVANLATLRFVRLAAGQASFLASRDGALHKFPVVEVVASRRSRPSRCPRGMLLSKPGFAVCVWASCQGIDMDSSAEASHNCAHVRSVVFAVAYCSVRSYGHRASQLTRSGPSRCPRWVWRFRPRLRSVLGPRDRHRCG